MNEFLAVFHYATPVALAAIGETASQRSGIIQIGLEGTLLTSAFAAAAVAAKTGNPWAGVLAGVIAGILCALFSAWFCIKLAADQVVVGTAINLLALGLTGALYRSNFVNSGGMPSFPKIGASSTVDPVMILTLILGGLVWWLFKRTNWGLMADATGELPEATEASGFVVSKIRFQAIALGGALAGLGGAYLSVGIVGAFSENMTSGRGFVAIAMVTFGRWNPIGAVAASLLIGFAEGLQFTLQARGPNVPFQLLLALPYVLALAVLVLLGKGARGPASLGLPYRRNR